MLGEYIIYNSSAMTKDIALATFQSVHQSYLSP